MELINATKMVAGYTMGMDPSGREYLVVAIKGTFTLPLDGSEPVLAEQQDPLVEADEFTGEPGFSATLRECDYPLHKRRCDVIVNGSAYAPGGEPATRVQVALKMPGIDKKFDVVGDRYWIAGPAGIGVTAAEPFTQKFISYDVAFGGTDTAHPDPDKKDAYMANPVGRGWHRHLSSQYLHDTPLPNTEAPGERVTNPAGNYRPISFGCIARSWPERVKWAGTYDQNWVDNIFPFLPPDFDSRYYQAAPEDQQCDYLRGGEQVQLLNLTPAGRTAFTLPQVEVPVVFFHRDDGDIHCEAVADTLLIEPDRGCFSITWRISQPLKRNIFEISPILVGTKSRGWWRARQLGKTYYSSLDSLARANRAKETSDVEG